MMENVFSIFEFIFPQTVERSVPYGTHLMLYVIILLGIGSLDNKGLTLTFS